jgi:hypothetical protein
LEFIAIIAKDCTLFLLLFQLPLQASSLCFGGSEIALDCCKLGTQFRGGVLVLGGLCFKVGIALLEIPDSSLMLLNLAVVCGDTVNALRLLGVTILLRLAMQLLSFTFRLYRFTLLLQELSVAVPHLGTLLNQILYTLIHLLELPIQQSFTFSTFVHFLLLVTKVVGVLLVSISFRQLQNSDPSIPCLLFSFERLGLLQLIYKCDD